MPSKISKPKAIELCKKHGLCVDTYTSKHVDDIRRNAARESHPDKEQNEDKKRIAENWIKGVNVDCDDLQNYIELRDRERSEQERQEKERKEEESAEKERNEQERLKQEHAKQESTEQEQRKIEREHQRKEWIEQERIKQERKERRRQEWMERTHLDHEIIEKNSAEQERIKKEAHLAQLRQRVALWQQEQKRIEQEKIEQNSKEQERIEKEQRKAKTVELCQKYYLHLDTYTLEQIDETRRAAARNHSESELDIDNKQIAENILDEVNIDFDHLKNYLPYRDREQELIERRRIEQERIQKEFAAQLNERMALWKEERRIREQPQLDRIERERKERERREQERQERERIEQERIEQERIEKERIEKERREQERQEQERIKQKRIEEARKERERREQERQEQELLQKIAKLHILVQKYQNPIPKIKGIDEAKQLYDELTEIRDSMHLLHDASFARHTQLVHSLRKGTDSLLLQCRLSQVECRSSLAQVSEHSKQQVEGAESIGKVAGGIVGGVLGLIAGPFGVAFGAFAGALAGSIMGASTVTDEKETHAKQLEEWKKLIEQVQNLQTRITYVR